MNEKEEEKDPSLHDVINCVLQELFLLKKKQKKTFRVEINRVLQRFMNVKLSS